MVYVGGGVILTGKPKCNGRKFCSIATVCTTNHTRTSTMLCELNFQSNWKKIAGQKQSGDVQMPSHHTAKKYEGLEKWWKRICRHKNFRQLSVDMAVKFFWHQKSFISDVWFAYSVLMREITFFQCQLCGGGDNSYCFVLLLFISPPLPILKLLKLSWSLVTDKLSITHLIMGLDMTSPICTPRPLMHLLI